MACEVCEATYEWGRTEESRTEESVGRKKVPKGEWRCHACE